MRRNQRKIGAAYEEMAAAYLEKQGYAIIERNYRNTFGELDIIAEKDNVIAYIEIKYRTDGKCGEPLEAVDHQKQKKISKVAACHYVNYCALTEKSGRFDVIGIDGAGKLTHIEDAFAFQGVY